MDPLDRLYWRLVEQLRRERPGAAWELTIAEIYQQLVPYRAVRGVLGFAELPEYEHALLRLLAGEREYVSLDIPEVQEELRRELGAPNPILGLYRDYAAVLVRVNPAPTAHSPAPTPSRLPEPGEDVTAETPHPAAPPVAAPAPRPRAPSPPPSAAPHPPRERQAPVPPVAPPRPSLCRACHTPLPEGREVRFCPFCGVTQRAIPCAGCGELVDPEWKFCAGCGLPQRSGAP